MTENWIIIKTEERKTSGLNNIMFCFSLLTHGGGEDDDAQDVHLLAGARTRFVRDIWRRGQLKVHCPTFRVILIWEDVDEVGLHGSGWDFEDGNQVRFVLKEHSRVSHSKCKRYCTLILSSGGCVTCWNVASIRLEGTMFLLSNEETRSVIYLSYKEYMTGDYERSCFIFCTTFYTSTTDEQKLLWKMKNTQTNQGGPVLRSADLQQDEEESANMPQQRSLQRTAADSTNLSLIRSRITKNTLISPGCNRIDVGWCAFYHL